MSWKWSHMFIQGAPALGTDRAHVVGRIRRDGRRRDRGITDPDNTHFVINEYDSTSPPEALLVIALYINLVSPLFSHWSEIHWSVLLAF